MHDLLIVIAFIALAVTPAIAVDKFERRTGR
jgi:hypothetical protein